MSEQQPVTETVADDALVMTQRVGAPPEAVFEFFVDPEKLMRWMGTKAELDPRPGGRFWVNVNGTDIAVGEYLTVERPGRVAFTWGWDASTAVPAGSSTVTITLTADGDGTVVELRHEGLPGGAGDQHAEGWNHFLPLLAAAAGRG